MIDSDLNSYALKQCLTGDYTYEKVFSVKQEIRHFRNIDLNSMIENNGPELV